MENSRKFTTAILISVAIAFSSPLFAAKDTKRPDILPEYKPVVWPIYSGSKIQVAVLPFEDGVRNEHLFTSVYSATGIYDGLHQPWVSGGGIATWPLGDGLADMLVSTLMITNRFSVLDRKISQQAFDLFSHASAEKLLAGGGNLPRVAGLKYFIAGTVTAVNDGEASAEGSLKIAGIKLKAGVQVASVVVQLRLIDATNGQTLYSKEIEGTVMDTQASVGIDGLSASLGTPFGRAKQKTVDLATDSIITKLFSGVPSVFIVPEEAEPDEEPESSTEAE